MLREASNELPSIITRIRAEKKEGFPFLHVSIAHICGSTLSIGSGSKAYNIMELVVGNIKIVDRPAISCPARSWSRSGISTGGFTTLCPGRVPLLTPLLPGSPADLAISPVGVPRAHPASTQCPHIPITQ